MQVFARNVLRQAEKGMRPGGAGLRFARKGELPAEGTCASCEKDGHPAYKVPQYIGGSVLFAAQIRQITLEPRGHFIPAFRLPALFATCI